MRCSVESLIFLRMDINRQFRQRVNQLEVLSISSRSHFISVLGILLSITSLSDLIYDCRQNQVSQRSPQDNEQYRLIGLLSQTAARVSKS
jgi:hypothetical protein